MTELIKKKKLMVDNIKKIEKQINDDAIFSAWSKGDLNERMKRLDQLGGNLNESNMEMVCKSELSDADAKENEELDELVMSLKAKVSDRIDEIESDIRNQNAQSSTQSHSIRVIQTDAAGNIPNTWGTFSGQYDKWHSFRARWLPVHTNKDMQVVTKFQLLKAACIGDAAGALGEWDITEEIFNLH